MKPKIGIYLTDDVAKRLKIAARRPGATKSGIVNEALDGFLGPAREKDQMRRFSSGWRVWRKRFGRCSARRRSWP